MTAADHISEQLPAYALGALDDAEAAAVRRHLQTCPACREELTVYESVVEQLALAAPQETPPASLQERLLARIHRAREEQRPTVVAAPPPSASRWQQLRRRLSAPLWQPLALLLLLLLALTNWWWWQQRPSAPSAGLTTITLSGSETSPQAQGVVVMSEDGRHGTLVVDRLPDLGSAEQYQLWLIREDGQRDDGGVFSVGDDGYKSLWIDAPRPLDEYAAFGVTIEPAGGSPGPSGQRVLGSNP